MSRDQPKAFQDRLCEQRDAAEFSPIRVELLNAEWRIYSLPTKSFDSAGRGMRKLERPGTKGLATTTLLVRIGP